MSYFAAHTISIDKQNKTYKLKGGDNNVIPRSNYWTDEAPLRQLLPGLASGCEQFTARSDKHIEIEAIVNKYNRMLLDRFGLGAYDMWTFINGKLHTEGKTFVQYYQERVQSWKDDEAKYSGDYAKVEMARDQKRLDIASSLVDMGDLGVMLADFEREILALKPKPKNYIVSNGQWHIAKQKRNSADTTMSRDRAQRFTQAKANETAGKYAHAGFRPELVTI